MQIRALIVDDEPLARERIASLLDGEADVTIVGEAGDGRSAVREMRRKSPDLVFLDIQLPEWDGFEILRSIEGSRLAVIFVTAYDRYALEAFRVHAVDYLLKPVHEDGLREAVSRARWYLRHGGPSRPDGVVGALREVERAREGRVVVKTEGEVVCLRPSEIDWIESAGNYVCFHVGPRTQIARETMREVEERLLAFNFVRIHRSAIVNCDRIRRLKALSYGDYEVELRDGVKLPMSRGYRRTVLARVTAPG
jgi:two-component system LytT family response regulator